MSSSLLDAAFAHHVWATLRVIDACLARSAEELETSVLGTRGPMLETLRHVVAGDTLDLYILTGDRAFDIDVEHVSLAEARVVMERNGYGWAEFISRSLDPDAIVREVDKTDEYERWAPVRFRLAAALDHGTDHRSQICTAPRRSVWSRRRSMFTTSDLARAGSWRSFRTRSVCRNRAASM